jgi:hypothetical protein
MRLDNNRNPTSIPLLQQKIGSPPVNHVGVPFENRKARVVTTSGHPVSSIKDVVPQIPAISTGSRLLSDRATTAFPLGATDSRVMPFRTYIARSGNV